MGDNEQRKALAGRGAEGRKPGRLVVRVRRECGQRGAQGWEMEGLIHGVVRRPGALEQREHVGDKA